MLNKQTYLELVRKLNELAKKYYQDNDSSYPDEQYDLEYRQLVEFEKLNPRDLCTYSPTQRIGYFMNTPFAKVSHKTKMQSLDNVFDETELFDWVVSKPQGVFIVGEYKCDGIALDLTYEDGVLVQALTRGDGFIGEDVTHNALTIKNIPRKVRPTLSGNIRGEVVITREDFQILNATREAQGEVLFANPRNTAAGAMRQLDSEECRSRNLTFIAYDAGGDFKTTTSHRGNMQALVGMGFSCVDAPATLTGGRGAHTSESIRSMLENLAADRNKPPYEIDGIVWKIDDPQYHTRTDSKSPDWAVAYKFPAMEVKAQLLDVRWQVGRTGVHTPVAVIDPVQVCGVTVENITLHNPDFIRENKIQIPCELTIIRSGDVIPKVVGVSHLPNGYDITIPIYCCGCGSPLKPTPTNKQIFCDNRECEVQLIMFWENFVSRLAMNIVGVSVETIRQLVAEKFLTHRLDSMYLLYGMVENIVELDGWSDVSVSNMINAIHKSRTTTKQRLITGLGIEGIGSSSAKLISRIITNVRDLPNLTTSDIENIRGLGKITATDWVTYWADPIKRDSFLSLVEMLTITDETEIKEIRGKYAMTGKMPEISRKDLEKVLIEKGYELTNTISADLLGLFVGDKPSSKLAKAKTLNIPLLTFDDIKNIA